MISGEYSDYLSDGAGADADTWDNIKDFRGPEPPDSELTSNKPCCRWRMPHRFGWCCFGGILVIIVECAAIVLGIVQLPSSGQDLDTPSCYACVGLPPLDGSYTSTLDLVQGGIEFKVGPRAQLTLSCEALWAVFEILWFVLLFDVRRFERHKCFTVTRARLIQSWRS